MLIIRKRQPIIGGCALAVSLVNRLVHCGRVVVAFAAVIRTVGSHSHGGWAVARVERTSRHLQRAIGTFVVWAVRKYVPDSLGSERAFLPLDASARIGIVAVELPLTANLDVVLGSHSHLVHVDDHLHPELPVLFSWVPEAYGVVHAVNLPGVGATPPSIGTALVFQSVGVAIA